MYVPFMYKRPWTVGEAHHCTNVARLKTLTLDKKTHCSLDWEDKYLKEPSVVQRRVDKAE